MSNPSLVVYGNFVSQPSRALQWVLAIKGVPHKFVRVDPLKGEASTDEFLAKFPLGFIPCIEEADGFRLSEAHAILTYLASKHGWTDLYPTDLKRRAVVDQWLHWHHTGMRPFTTIFFRNDLLILMGKGSVKQHSPLAKTFVKDSMLSLAFGALKHSPFLAGDTVTLADICAYCELDQIEAIDAIDFTPWPEVLQWMTRMKALPKHDEVRVPLVKIAGIMKAAKAKASAGKSKL